MVSAFTGHRKTARLLGFACAAWGFAADAATAQPPAAPAAAAPAVAPMTYTLGECLAIAGDRQPAIKAARASVNATLIGERALANLSPVASLVSRDLPVRKEQASRGVTVALADLQKSKSDTVYDVTFLYYSYVYAKQQEQTTIEVLDRVTVFYDIAQDLLKQGPSPKLNSFTIYAIEEALAEIKKLRIDARNGQLLALAALKEAMGLDQSTDFLPADKELPVMAGNPTQDYVIQLALSRRPELAQAAAGVDAFRLEVCAQDKVRYRQTVPTLATGSDLHARLVPAPLRNGEYKPGAVPPEMPPTLVGKRADRVAKAVEYSHKQDEIYAKTRELIQLEAVNAYLGWKAAAEKLELAKERFDRSQKFIKLSRENAPNIREYDVLVRNEAIAAKAQGDYVQAGFETIKALARLERVTAGGISPAYPGK